MRPGGGHTTSSQHLCVFRKSERPFAELTPPDKSEFSVGQLLQLKMMEIMYLGYLLDVNPFDQPNVEMYKRETQRLLAGARDW